MPINMASIVAIVRMIAQRVGNGVPVGEDIVQILSVNSGRRRPGFRIAGGDGVARGSIVSVPLGIAKVPGATPVGQRRREW
jgi:hypothetical protein